MKINLRGGAHSTLDVYLAGHMSSAVYKLSKKASLNDCERAEYCRPLNRGPDHDPFFCELGTIWCTESHGGSWQDRGAKDLQRIVRKLHRWPRCVRILFYQIKLKISEAVDD